MLIQSQVIKMFSINDLSEVGSIGGKGGLYFSRISGLFKGGRSRLRGYFPQINHLSLETTPLRRKIICLGNIYLKTRHETYLWSTIPNGPIIEKIFQHHAYISKITVLILQYTMQTKVTSFMFTQKGYNTGYTVYILLVVDFLPRKMLQISK